MHLFAPQKGEWGASFTCIDRAIPGFPYAEMEKKGVLSPVKSLACDYKHACTFGDEISIAVSVISFNGVVLTIGYDMRNPAGDEICSARSEHVFINREGHFVRMKREMPEFCSKIEELTEAS